MNDALDGAIEKWEKIVNDGAEDHGTKDCALCIKYYYLDCGGCPVAEDGYPECCGDGSTWEAWADHQMRCGDGDTRIVTCDECKKLAQAEMDYLKGLRDG